jgi:hypothetical protein
MTNRVRGRHGIGALLRSRADQGTEQKIPVHRAVNPRAPEETKNGNAGQS